MVTRKTVPRVAIKGQQGQFLVFWVGGNLFIRMASLFHQTILQDFKVELGEGVFEVAGKVLGGGHFKPKNGELVLYGQSKLFGQENREDTLAVLRKHGFTATA